MNYWFDILGQRFGPYSASQLKALMNQGKVPQDAVIWDPARERWVPPATVFAKPTNPTLESMPPPSTPPFLEPPSREAPTAAGWYPSRSSPGHWSYWTGTGWSKTPSVGMAGWFREPGSTSMHRYWDGVGWSEQRRPEGNSWQPLTDSQRATLNLVRNPNVRWAVDSGEQQWGYGASLTGEQLDALLSDLSIPMDAMAKTRFRRQGLDPVPVWSWISAYNSRASPQSESTGSVATQYVSPNASGNRNSLGKAGWIGIGVVALLALWLLGSCIGADPCDEYDETYRKAEQEGDFFQYEERLDYLKHACQATYGG